MAAKTKTLIMKHVTTAGRTHEVLATLTTGLGGNGKNSYATYATITVDGITVEDRGFGSDSWKHESRWQQQKAFIAQVVSEVTTNPAAFVALLPEAVEKELETFSDREEWLIEELKERQQELKELRAKREALRKAAKKAGV